MPKKTTKTKVSETKEPSGAPKVFDVAKPGETAADASSRPLIVGHGSIMKQDPMVVDPDPASEPKSVSKQGVSIQPTSEIKEEAKVADGPKATTIQVFDEAPKEKPEESAKEKGTVEPVTEKTEEPTVEPEKTKESPESTTDTTEPNESKEEPATEQPESSEAAATNALANELVAKKEAEQKAKESAKKTEELQGLIASKKYYVNIHQSATSGGAGKWILLLLLLLIVGAVAAIDAGLVDVGLTLPFDLIQNR